MFVVQEEEFLRSDCAFKCNLFVDYAFHSAITGINQMVEFISIKQN